MSTAFSRLQPWLFFSAVLTNLRSCRMSFALYMVMSEVVAAGMMMMGVRDTLLGTGRGAGAAAVEEGVVGTGAGAGAGATGRLGWVPSVTDLRFMPWYVPIVSILKPSVSSFPRKRS
uniref:Putative secreted protein n=1 Tax=Ixodes ricinus TaxID=34613 RepID=A0A6B0UM59_IXORI